MIDILNFAFQSFWHFWGTLLLLCAPTAALARWRPVSIIRVTKEDL
jgi:hypothetical protein